MIKIIHNTKAVQFTLEEERGGENKKRTLNKKTIEIKLGGKVRKREKKRKPPL